MSEALKQVYASNPIDQNLIQTIEVRDAVFEGGALRFADWDQDLRLRTDRGWFDFKSANIQPIQPAKDASGGQDLSLRIGDALREYWRQARLVVQSRREGNGAPEIILRTFLTGDLSMVELQYSGFAKGFRADETGIVITAGFKEIVNRSAMFDRYTSTNSPGLKYT